MKRSLLLLASIPVLLMSTMIFAGGNEKVLLKIDHTQKIAGEQSIKFTEVVEDSRCPEGTTCIWAGRAIIRIEIRSENSEARTVELEVANPESFACVNDFVIRAVKLDPYPKSETNTARDKYVVALTVDRVGKVTCD